MSTIVTRAGKGSPLTNNEVDANFTNLNTDKIQVVGTPTDGQAVIWDSANSRWIPGAVDALPDQTGNSGKFLTTDGADPSWAAVDALPSQTGNAGEYLTTDGTDAAWSDTITATTVTASNGIFVNSQTIATSYTIATGKSGMSSGPVSIASGQSVTISSGSRWVVV